MSYAMQNLMNKLEQRIAQLESTVADLQAKEALRLVQAIDRQVLIESPERRRPGRPPRVKSDGSRETASGNR